MRKLPPEVLALPLHQRAEMALKAAVRKVVEEHARLGLPLYISSQGRVVAASAKKVLAQYRRQESAAKQSPSRKAPSQKAPHQNPPRKRSKKTKRSSSGPQWKR